MKYVTFGLTGGIACGKSTATKTFRANDIPIVDADIIARQVVKPGTVGLAQIINCFGSEYLQSDGTLNRISFGKLVFGNAEALKLTDNIMAPLINHEARRQIRAWHIRGYKIVGYDAALICEQGNASKFNPLVVVHCTHEQQMERLMRRGVNGVSLTREEAMARIATQMSVPEKMKMADYLIDTSGTMEQSVAQTEAIIEKLKCMTS